MATYFFRSCIDEGRGRLRALDGQNFPDGGRIDPTKNVSADKTIRGNYPFGTYFVSDDLSEPSNGTFYKAGRIYPVHSSATIPSEALPPNEMVMAFKQFVATKGISVDGVEARRNDEKQTSPKRKSYYQKLLDNPSYACPTIEKDGFFVTLENWYLLVRNILNGVNTMLIGPTGTGKTELIALACKKLGIKLHVYDMGSMIDPISGLLGVHRLQKGGESVFDYAQFTKDIQEPCVILLDELSRAPATTNNILFPCLDSRRNLPVEIAGGNDMRSIPVHDKVCFIATANIGSEYTGTMSMDRALVGRFFPVELNYLPKSSEVDLLKARTGITQMEGGQIVNVAESIRTLYQRAELSATVSTRETLMAAELLADGWSMKDAVSMVFLPLFEGTKTDGERSQVVKILMTA